MPEGVFSLLFGGNPYRAVIEMNVLTSFFAAIPDAVYDAIFFLTRITAVLYVFFSIRYRNGEHKLRYYLPVLLIPVIGVIIFTVKRKEMNGVGMKVCPSCKSKYPPEFVTCYKCNIELPEYDAKRKSLEKLLAVLMLVVFCLMFAFNTVYEVVLVVHLTSHAVDIDQNGHSYGIYENNDGNATDGFIDENGEAVYYDMKGNTYYSPEDVVFYTEDGQQYVYSNALEKYTSGDGAIVSLCDAFVDEKGYFVDCAGMELYLSDDDGKQTYYDKDDNVYYCISDVGWTQDGRLIKK